MASLNLDKRTLLKLYIEEDGTDLVLQVVNDTEIDRVVIADLARVETRTAVRQREGDISTLEADRVLQKIDNDGLGNLPDTALDLGSD